MKILVHGNPWVGMWVESVADGFSSHGHEVQIVYHALKTPALRVKGKLNRLLKVLDAPQRFDDLVKVSQNRLLEAMQTGCDVLVCLQSHVDQALARELKALYPELRIVYWWCDILREKGLEILVGLGPFVDLILSPFQGSVQLLRDAGVHKVAYCPFAISADLHRGWQPTTEDRVKFSAQVSFVGHGYRERADIIRRLNRHLRQPVRVWGRGWDRYPDIRGQAPISMQDSLKVYACSEIALNPHGTGTPNGFNMRFFEIPVAGGFQLCDWQPEIANLAVGRFTETWRSEEEMVEKVQYYLAHPEKRYELSTQAHAAVLAHDTYVQRAERMLQLLEQMATSGAVS